MVDIPAQVDYWRKGAQEDWEVARGLLENGKTRHGMFFAHLALEKLLKAQVCRKTEQIAPRIHNLVRLSEIADLTPEPEFVDILAEMNEFNLEGRYPLTFLEPLTKREAHEYMERASKVFQWLIRQL